MDRRSGVSALLTVLKNKTNVIAFERKVFKDSSSDDDYKSKMYQMIGGVLEEKHLKPLHKERLGRFHQSLNECRKTIQEHDDFVENPFEIEEGVLECTKCGSKKVFSVTKQDRACDEGMNTYAQCVNCKSKWTIRG